MSLGMPASCINHPGIEAAIRCKQCGTPVCAGCKVGGPTGNFCGETCRDKHEQFVRRAQELEQRRPTAARLYKLRRFAVRLIVLAVLVLFIALVLTYFGIEVPYLSEQFHRYIDF